MPSACKALAGPRRTTRWMRGRLNEAILIPGGRAPSLDPEILLPKKEEETETRGKLAAPHADDRSLAPSGTRGSTGRHREEREDEQEDGEYGGSPHILSATI